MFGSTRSVTRTAPLRLPPMGSSATSTGLTFGYYSDSACTTPIAATKTGCTAPTYALQSTPDACGVNAPAVQVFAIATKVTPSAIYALIRASATMRVRLRRATTSTRSAQVPASSFVSATLAHD